MSQTYEKSVSPPLVKLVRFGRWLFPATLRPRIRTLLFQWLDLMWKLPSGVSVRIANYPDWIVYNAIFVTGEYDPPITRALDSAASALSMHVVALGA